MTDTIFARATGAGRGAVAILRLSGPDAGAITQQLAGALPKPRLASVRTLRNRAGEALDQALVLWMPGPNSFTGEDCAELHVHGGPAVLEGVSAELVSAGARSAEPGEFSRRAFAHGKLDLLQAEAVADLVDAETETQRRQALGQLEGAASRRYHLWRSRLIEALALVEAEIDFPDEDLPGAVSRQAEPLLRALAEDLSDALRGAGRGRQVRDGYRVALVGAPNSGKSSLFNALLGRDAAIVSPRPGTTRDVVEARLVIGGFSVTLADTAGIRGTGDEIEAEGIRRAQAWAEGASLRLLLAEPHGDLEGLSAMAAPGDLLVLTKSDQLPARDAERLEWAGDRGLRPFATSVVIDGGVDALAVAIEQRVQADLGATEQPAVTRARHEQALREALDAISAALTELEAAPDRAAEDIRQAALSLQAVVGHVDREAVLDQVFSAFCIGK